VLLWQQGGFKLSRGEIAQAGMYTLAIVDIAEEATNLLIGVVKILVVRKRNSLFLNGAHETLGIAILPSFTDFSHADGDSGIGKQVTISRGSILDTLV
jgi:hypothetical protein